MLNPAELRDVWERQIQTETHHATSQHLHLSGNKRIEGSEARSLLYTEDSVRARQSRP